jgi:hypothetical protein
MNAWKNKRIQRRERHGGSGRSNLVINVEHLESRLLLSSIPAGMLTAFGASSSGTESPIEPPPPLFRVGAPVPQGWMADRPWGRSTFSNSAISSNNEAAGRNESAAAGVQILDWPAVDMTSAINQSIPPPNFGDPSSFTPPPSIPTTGEHLSPEATANDAPSVDLQAADPLPDAAAMTVGDSVSGSRPFNIYRVPIDPGTVAVRIMLKSMAFTNGDGAQMALMDPTGKVIGEWRDHVGGDPLDVTFVSTVNQLPPVVYIGVWTTSTAVPQASGASTNPGGVGSDYYLLSVDKQTASNAAALPSGQLATSVVPPIGPTTSLYPSTSGSSSSSDSQPLGGWKQPPQALSSAPSSFSDQSGVTFGQGGGTGGSATGPLPQFFAGPEAGILGVENSIRDLNLETIAQGLVEGEAFDTANAPFTAPLVQNTSGYLIDETGEGTNPVRSTSAAAMSRSTLGFAGSPVRIEAEGFNSNKLDHALASLSYHLIELDRIALLNASIAAGGDPDGRSGGAERVERGDDGGSKAAVLIDLEGVEGVAKLRKRAVPKAVGIATVLGVLLYMPDLALKQRGRSREIASRKKLGREAKS